MIDIRKEIPELDKSHVHIKNPDKVYDTINNIAQAGFDKLQIVSDFDKTITKQHEEGKAHLSSFAMFSKCPSVTEQHLSITQGLADKYVPIENDPTIPVLEKTKHMELWWLLTEEALKGLEVTPEEISEVCLQLGPEIRDGTKQLFDDLYEAQVPVLVFSAGLGDTVVSVLKQCDILLPNVEVVSNFLKYDSKGRILGFKDRLIHVYNKNEFALKGTDFYNKIVDRDNVILLGDSIGDASMVEGMDHLTNILRIGFLYERSKEALPNYMDTFDIVLEDDQTMDVPQAIMSYIQKNAQHRLN